MPRVRPQAPSPRSVIFENQDGLSVNENLKQSIRVQATELIQKKKKKIN